MEAIQLFLCSVTKNIFLRPIGINQNILGIMRRKDNQLIVITHLSQLSSFVVGFGSLIVPLILWACNKNDVFDMDEQGKLIVNFQLSMIIYAIASIPLILFFGLGLLTLLAVAVLLFIMPIINAFKVSNGSEPYYPLTIKML